jgi:hypothetical protein
MPVTNTLAYFVIDEEKSIKMLTTGVPFCHPSHTLLEGALRVAAARQEGERRVHRKLDGHGDGANPAGTQDAPGVPEVVRSSPARHS